MDCRFDPKFSCVWSDPFLSRNNGNYYDGCKWLSFWTDYAGFRSKSMDIDYCLVGHSERRKYFNEDSEMLAGKVDQLLENDISPIFCCGEVLEEHETEKHFEVLEYLRKEDAAGAALSIRKVGKSGIVDIKGLYVLFPGGPLKFSSKYAGIAKPSSCV